ncbi:ATP-binding protein [Haloferula helveola]|uniref:ATP-binding protein n=1 Tax=Haloferula helveola TaxID=490095 RepID=UPI0030CC3F59
MKRKPTDSHPRESFPLNREFRFVGYACLLIFSALLAGCGKGSGTGGGDHSLRELHDRQRAIDLELQELSHATLNSGIGAIGYRSINYLDADHPEWIEIDLGREVEIDEITLVPTLWRSMRSGFVSDGFPQALRVIVGSDGPADNTLVADIPDTSHLLPRVAPLILPAGGTKGSRVRIEVDRLGTRAFDNQHILQLAEVLIFSGEENVALHREVRSSSNSTDLLAWNRDCLVDGILPYLMNSGRGVASLAYVSPTTLGDEPSMTLDLGAPVEATGIRLHAVDQTDTVPQAFSGDFGLPGSVRIEASDHEDFSDPLPVTIAELGSLYRIGPIMEWSFPTTTARYWRLTAIDPFVSSEAGRLAARLGFAEIEILDQGVNRALNAIPTTSFPEAPSSRRISSVTDGHNLYGTILPLRQWLNELARRHELEAKRPAVATAIARKNLQIRKQLTLMIGLTGLLAIAVVGVALYSKFKAVRLERRIRERISANLHDELGANLHAIGLLGDLAKDSVDSKDDLLDIVDRIRSLTERTGSAARNCANMLAAKGVCEDLVEDLSRDSDRILADLENSLSVRGQEHLHQLTRRKRMDLYLFHKEALVNVIRHSGATTVETVLESVPGKVSLRITDNGKGLDGAPPASLRRRAQLMGAELSIEQPEAGGTCLFLNLKTRRLGFR